MENLKIYEIENAYIDYLVPFAPHLFNNKKEGQKLEEKCKLYKENHDAGDFVV